MKKNPARTASHARRLLLVVGLMLLGCAGFLLLTKPAEMHPGLRADKQALADSAAQPDTLGRLAYAVTISTFSGPRATLCTSNADGSGRTCVTEFPPYFPREPAWSPDGSKIAFVTFDVIHSINANGTGGVMLGPGSNPSWSVTGKIAYQRSDQIWVMNEDGSNQMQFAGITQPTPTAPAWSPDGTKLAFTSGGRIYVIDANGMNQLPVTNNAQTDSNPAWSPDGSKIVFAKNGSIHVINLDGSNETNLSHGTVDIEPAWSSDGTKIAFARKSGIDNGLYVMDVNGANQRRIIEDVPGSTGNVVNSPAWQPVPQAPDTFVIHGRVTRVGAGVSSVTVSLIGPSGTTTTVTDSFGSYRFDNVPAGGNYTVHPFLAYNLFAPASRAFNNLSANQLVDFTATETCIGTNCSRNGRIAFERNSEIYSMNADGSNQINLSNNPGLDTAPAYSPDGSKIVFVSARDGNNEIYRMNADGSSPLRLTNNTADDGVPAYSPDGSKIVFSSFRDGNYEIYRMDADGMNQTRLTNVAGTDYFPSYHPDGSKILFTANRSGFSLRTMNADGTNETLLTNTPQFYGRASYSPDGSKIVFVYGQDVTTQTNWVMNADGSNRMTLPNGGDGNPSFSPDGRKVVLTCCLVVQSLKGIYTVNAEGTGRLRLTADPSDTLPKWQPLRVARVTAFDFDGDTKSDVAVWRPADGYWYRLNSGDGQFTYSPFGTNGDKIAPADYDGDGRTDMAVWRETTPDRAYFHIWQSAANSYRFEQFGAAGDVPVSGDFDGDSRADVAVFRAGTAGNPQSYFFYRPSSQPGVDFRAIEWGALGDKPVAADYDGDGKTDAAIFRPSNGGWYVLQSSNNQLLAISFGLSTDRPVVSDYDGDGRADMAVYRNGDWYLNRSTQGFTALNFGIASDTPTPADYDGDGRADISVFRDGTWYIQQSSDGLFRAVNFGMAGDKPAPAAFVP